MIGILGEKTLHAALKLYFEPDVNKHEVKIGSFVADIITDKGIIEIQTRSLNMLRNKLTAFLKNSSVTVVYPLARIKWLIWIDEQTGEITKKRKSPKRGGIYDAVFELYKIRPFLNHPNFKLCIVFADMEEYRYLNGWSNNKKRGSTRYDRVPVNIAEIINFNTPADYMMFMPNELPTQFTSRDYKEVANINLRTAQTALNILNYIGTVERIGKKGKLYIYERRAI